MSEIRISIDEVREASNSIRNYNKELDNVLSKTRRLINELNDYWISDASNSYQMKFNEFCKLYESAHADLETYASFLIHTADSYKTLDSTIASNANEII